jgi:dihydroorotase/N-acyl-D-amino-acid deacylase
VSVGQARLLLAGGQVADGSGAPLRPADVLIDGGFVTALQAGSADVDERLDVSGLVVAPGFIDTHTHSDAAPWLPPDAEDVRLANLRQGVTTEVCGNCGFSLFPALPGHLADVQSLAGGVLGAGARAFESFDEYADALGQRAMATNLAPLVGHGALRAGVMGFAAREATPDELDAMRTLLAAALHAGAFGMSSGLIYPPGKGRNTRLEGRFGEGGGRPREP